MEKEVVFIVTADTSQLTNGLGEVNANMTKIADNAKDAGENVKKAFTPDANTARYKKDYNDINNELRELNEKLRNEIALKKQGAAATARRIRDLEREKKAIDAQVAAMTRQQTAGQRLTSVMGKLGIAIGAAFAIRAIARFAVASTKAYDDAIAAETKLLTALKGRQGAQQILLAQATALQRSTRFADEQIVEAQTRLAKLLGNNVDAIKELTPLVLDFATVQGMDAASAADLVAKAVGSQTNALGRYGIQVEGAVGSTERLNMVVAGLTKQFQGQAEAVAAVGRGPIIKLKNQFGDLQEALGERFLRTMNNLSQRFSGLIGDFTEFVKIPLSQKLEEERLSVNGLVTALISQRNNAEARNKLYNELNQIAPELLKNINQENINVTALTANLRAYNEQQINRIVLQKEFEALQKAQSDEASARQRVIQDEIRAGKIIAEAEQFLTERRSAQLPLLQQARRNYESGAIALESYISAVQKAIDAEKAQTGNFKASISTQQELSRIQNDLLIVAAEYATDLEDVTNTTVGTIQATESFDQVQQRLGITLEDNTVKIPENTEVTDKNTDANKEATTAVEKLRKEIADLNKELENQVVTDKAAAQETVKKIALKEKELQQLENLIQRLRDIQAFTEAGVLNLDIVPRIRTIPTDTELPDELTASDYWSDLGEVSAQSWLDGFIQTIVEIEDEQQLEAIKSALNDALEFVVDAGIDLLAGFDDTALRSLDILIESLDQRINATESALDRELELKKAGFANNYELERENLAQLRALQDQAIADREKQIEKQRQQEQTRAIIQTVAASISTVAQAYSEGGPIAGTIIAALALASLISLIASAKSQASSAAQFEHGTAQILGGRSHAGGGVNLGELGEAEKDEFLGIASRKGTRKYGKGLMNLFDGINSANNDKLAIGLQQISLKSGLHDDLFGGTMQHDVSLREVNEIKDIRNILKRQPTTIIYENGRRIEKSGGRTRTIYVN